MPAPYPENPASSTTDERRSAKVFTGVLLLVLLAVAFPQMSPHGLQGILWAGAGLLMLLWPPVVRLPRVWGWLVAGFVCFP